MYLCIRFLAFLAIALATVTAHYHYVITYNAEDGEGEGEKNRQRFNSFEFDLPYGVSSGWCAPEETENKNVSGTVTRLGKTAPWYCTFYAMMNQSANCITTFRTAERKLKYVLNIEEEERRRAFIIESNETETQINIKSPFTIDLGRCALQGTRVNRYYADSMIVLDHAGKWSCRFDIHRRRPVNILIQLRSSEQEETEDGKGPILITQDPEDQNKMNALLTMSKVQCANYLRIIRPNLNSSYISLDITDARSDTWECNFHNHALNTSCIFKVRHFSTNDIGSPNVTSMATEFTSTATNVTPKATNVASTAMNVTSTATNATSASTNVASTAINVTSSVTNVASTALNVTSTATSIASTNTNLTSMATNVTSTATNSIEMIRDADILQPSMSPSELVNVIFVGPALLIIGLLLCGLLYYRKQVKMNEIPDNIKSRAPMELPSEVIYETVYSHIAGYRQLMEKKQTSLDNN